MDPVTRRIKMLDRGFSETVVDMVQAMTPADADLWAETIINLNDATVARMNMTARRMEQERATGAR